MALPRQDVRAKLDHDYHIALVAFAAADNVTIAEFIERELVRVIRQRFHNHKLLEQEIGRLRISGNLDVEIPTVTPES